MKLKIKNDKVNSFVESIITKYLKSGCKCFGWFLKDLCVGEDFSIYDIDNKLQMAKRAKKS